MARNATYNILMYSHDTYGLGHIRRSLAIAAHLLAPRLNILILTGSPIAGRFRFPEQIDFVRIPGMIKRTNEEYLPLSIKIHPRHALDIRKNIITATVKSFQPQLFIVDKEPLGLKREVLPALQWLRRSRPAARTVLGLRDILAGVDALPEEQRSVLLLVGVEDLSYEQAARVLGLPVGTVMSRLHRGRRQLRDMLADYVRANDLLPASTVPGSEGETS